MQVKNISGRELAVKLGRQSLTLAANQTATYPDTPAAIADANRFITLGYLELITAPVANVIQGDVDVPASVLLAFTGQPTAAETITINGVVFEAVAAAEDVTEGNVAYVLGGSVAATVAALQTAVAANATLKAARISITDKITVGASDVRALVRGVDTTAVSVSEGSTNVAATTVAAVNRQGYRSVKTVVTAAATTHLFDSGLEQIIGVQVQVRSAAGAVKAYDGVVQLSDGLIYLDASGSADIASTDLITIDAWGK